jgi:integrase
VEERRQAERPVPQKGLTFRDAAEACIKSQIPTWRSPKSEQQWRSTLERYVYPSLGDAVCRDVTRPQILDVLSPIWESRGVTADRIRGRIQSVLGYAAALEGWSNFAANWRDGLRHLLSDPRKRAVQHHAAMPFGEVAAFWDQLRASSGVAARALEFVLLTAARSRPVRLATWSEIDSDAKIWTCPGAHMKGGQEFRAPLNDAALALLRSMAPLGSGPSSLIFPGLRNRPLSENSMQAVLHRMGVRATVHGFRSTFRDWAGEATDAQPDVAEAALDHEFRKGSRANYQRGDLLGKRRDLMGGWSEQVTG